MSVNPNPDPTRPPAPEKQTDLERSALFVATLTSFMGPFMISSVNVALPAIQKDLKMTAVQLGWVASAYLLAMAVGLIPAGKLADIHGRKKVFSIGLIVYTTGATAVALVHTTAWFLFLRVIQGLDAALLVGHRAITPDSYAGFLTGTRVVFAMSVGLCTVGIFFSMFRGRMRKP